VAPRRVELVPHDPTWAVQAAEEAALITFALGPAVICIEHVGSTSISGICAKPTIDLLPIATSLEALDAREGAMRALGYDWRGEFGLAGRRFCTREAPDGRRLFNVHCWAEGHSELSRHIAFRDYLRAHPDEAMDYEAEKLRAAAVCEGEMERYTDAKAGWIQTCQQRALAWAERSGRVPRI
jgi:GrpB-like predicted nucleotidyltransferase (UPF0157 family)